MTQADFRLSEPKKIAVLHAKALGDFIVTLPALTALKETYPDAELVLLAKPWVVEFLNDRPSPVDRVIAVPLYPGVHDAVETKGVAPSEEKGTSLRDIRRFYGAMRAEQFDAVLHMQGDGRSVNPFINQFRAGLTAGMRNVMAEPLDRSIPYVHYQSEVLRNLEIVGLIGAKTPHLEPRLAVTDADRAEAAAVTKKLGGAPYVVLHTGADDIRRLWPAAKFASVADTLAEKGYRIVLTGTPKEETTIQKVVKFMNHPALARTDLSLGGLAAVLQGSALTISNDTGPLHLARAVGAKTVGILWAPNVLNWGPLTRGSHRLAICWDLRCPECHTKPLDPWPFQPVTQTCDHPYSFVENISADEVRALALELLVSA